MLEIAPCPYTYRHEGHEHFDQHLMTILLCPGVESIRRVVETVHLPEPEDG